MNAQKKSSAGNLNYIKENEEPSSRTDSNGLGPGFAWTFAISANNK